MNPSTYRMTFCSGRPPVLLIGEPAMCDFSMNDRAVPLTISGVGSGSTRPKSAVKRLAAEVYDAQAGTRSPLLDGPWWLAVTVAVALGVLAFGSSPWKWLAAPVVVVLLSLPFCVRWAVALGRSVRAFRDGYRS